MYEELVARLKKRAVNLKEKFSRNAELLSELIQAADAIEELRQQVEHSVPVPPHGRLIEEADAIETAWMILRGLGYRKEENPQLEQTVHEVFATAPTIEAE